MYNMLLTRLSDFIKTLFTCFINSGYRGMDEDELFNREGLSPQQYLEFTERERPPNITTEPEMTFVSSPGEPGPRGPPGVSIGKDQFPVSTII